MKLETMLGLFASSALLACSSHAPPAPGPTPDQPMVRTRVISSQSFSPRTDEASLHAFVPDIAAVDSGGECSIIRTGGSGATVVSASFPDRGNSQTSVSITFDSVGHFIRYSERRGGSIRFTLPPGSTDAQRDSAFRASIDAKRATTVSFDYAIDQAIASNSGGGQLTVAVRSTVKAMEQLAQLGRPAERLTRVRKLCGV
jgi:hypothetical protein